MNAVFAPAARRDLLQAITWIAADNPQAAQALRDTVVQAARRIGEHPQIGTPRPDLADPPIRFLAMTGFPYLLVYDGDARPSRILRVLHGARDLPEVLADMI
jgi:toxin ParE1/3/4